ncbi:MAG TPA: tautomerase family protein, partial [Bryobacteraceae bacterium]|nr:tautomerase family protein [Bryobacteraceae bacterium]
MPQVKVYGLREQLAPIIPAVSDVIHTCVMEALEYPKDKRAHRFFPLDRGEFFYPAGRSDRYTIIEFSMFEGRSIDAKKKLIR